MSKVLPTFQFYDAPQYSDFCRNQLVTKDPVPVAQTFSYQDRRIRIEQYQNDDGKFRFAVKERGKDGIGYCAAFSDGSVVYEPLVDPLILKGAIVFPPAPHPEKQDPDTLFADLLKFDNSYVTVPKHYDVLGAGYSRMSWRLGSFSWCPYIRVFCLQERGKTRYLIVRQQTMYHGAVLGNMPAAIVYRSIERYGVSMLIDEISGKLDKDVSDALRLGTNKGTGFIWKNVLDPRTKKYVPEAYSCYGHKVLISQEAASDDKLSSRSFDLNMTNAERAASVPDDILPESAFYAEGEAIRARLFRDGLDCTWDAPADRPPEIPNDRQWQDLKGILSCTPAPYHADLFAVAARQRRAVQRDRSESPHGYVLQAIKNLGCSSEVDIDELTNAVAAIRRVPTVSDGDGGKNWDTRHSAYISPKQIGMYLTVLGFDEQFRIKGKRYRLLPAAKLERAMKDYTINSEEEESK